jgi:hypothetical protein
MASPSNVVATVVSPGSVSVSWAAPASFPEGDYYYIVYSKTENDVESVIGESLPINSSATSCTISGLKQGIAYSFVVGIVSVHGASPAPAVSASVQI